MQVMQDSELFAFADCELIGINSGTMLVINRQNGRQIIMMPQVVEGMKTCTNFNTIDGHATHLANTRPELQGNKAMAVTALNELKEAGMLLQAGSISSRMEQPLPRQLPPTRAFIITCDRPAAVERLLESMLRGGKLGQHNALFLVDDSRDPANREANREAVTKFNLRSPTDMLYVGEEAQQSLLNGLLEKLPNHSNGIHFLLDRAQWQGHKTYGRSRTLCLLLSVGYRALVMDDDILCQAMLPPISGEGVGIGSGGMLKAAFYANEQDMMQNSKPASFDPLGQHASLLGSTFSHAVREANNGPLRQSQLQNVNGALVNVLKPDSPVLVTQCGTLGDPGTGGAHWAMFLGDDSIERLVSAPQGVTAALEARMCWLGSARPNFFKMPFMSQMTGLDNSYLLPPYFPAFRGEDALFGAMLVAMHHDSVTLEYPWSVPHLPVEARDVSVESPTAAAGGTTLFARYLTERIDYMDGTDPEFNLNAIAQDALRMTARSDSALALDYRSALAKGQIDQLHMLQGHSARMEKYQSADIQDYFRRSTEDVQRAISEQQGPADLGEESMGLSEAEILDQFRTMATGFAEGLSGWVEMRDVASDLVDDMINSQQLLPL